jgi:hypothetical protein
MPKITVAIQKRLKTVAVAPISARLNLTKIGARPIANRAIKRAKNGINLVL